MRWYGLPTDLMSATGRIPAAVAPRFTITSSQFADRRSPPRHSRASAGDAILRCVRPACPFGCEQVAVLRA